MPNPLECYQKLGLQDSLSKIHRYPLACKELSFILKNAYAKFPKNLQALVFQDTLTAFRFLPGMQTCNAVSSAHLLLHSAEAALPKQKRNLAVTEFKHAMVAHKRRSKTRQEEKDKGCSAQLPQDVLVHVFSFLDVQSLVSVGQVCRSWNLAATDNHIWKLQYATFFGNYDNGLKTNGSQSCIGVKDIKGASLQEEMATGTSIDWREAFKRAYRGQSSKKLASGRGYCGYCDTIVWLDNTKCFNVHSGLDSENQISPVSLDQVVEYILGESSTSSSSDSDGDLDVESSYWFSFY
ncbi:F-box protein At5g52880 isoform X1 [Ziziphus jujuba]|uniref:F-box protein At5g52880 isoform X1 n=1 Tax=Ziziphus jujuba TaxID=326968 RepID=A0A6P3ZXN4_ZIZJJ|nr:F-box protein At5g52880 isoform X1 [Ziziphus jujuba]